MSTGSADDDGDGIRRFESDLSGVRLFPLRVVGELLTPSFSAWAFAYVAAPYGALALWPVLGVEAVGLFVTICGLLWIYVVHASVERKIVRTSIDPTARRLTLSLPATVGTGPIGIQSGSASADLNDVEAATLVPVSAFLFVRLEYGSFFEMRPTRLVVSRDNAEALVDALRRADVPIEGPSSGGDRSIRGRAGRWLKLVGTPILIGVVPLVLARTTYPGATFHLILPAGVAVLLFGVRASERLDLRPSTDESNGFGRRWVFDTVLAALALAVVLGVVLAISMLVV